MFKHVEITMQSGTKYYLVSTEDKKYVRRDIDYMLSGTSGASIQVNTSEDISSSLVYINPRLIESFKLVI